MKPLLAAALLLVATHSAQGSTLGLSGLLNESGGAFPQADGAFFISLTGTTLSYSITTLPLGDTFAAASAGLTLGLPSGDLPLPILGHQLFGFSGCELSFAAYEPLSFRDESSGLVFFPLGIGAPGDCRSYFQASILTGSVQLTQPQINSFSAPYFLVGSSTLGLYGRTDPNVVGIPEPASGVFAALAGLALFWRRVRRRAKPQT